MITGINVRIRPFERKDIELFYNWMSSQESLGCFMDPHLEYKESVTENMETFLKDKNRIYVIIEDNDGNPVGIMNCRQFTGIESTLEVGILIGDSSKRGKGLGKECLELFIGYLFKRKPIMRIQLFTRTGNACMRTVGERVGFTLEGILKKYKFEQGDYRDYCLMAITRDEWCSRIE